MPKIVAIVEGFGEVAAVPILIRRIADAVTPGIRVEVPRPIRVARQRVVRAGELERAIEFAARETGPEDGILVLLDADDDCPKELAPQLLGRAMAARGDRAIAVVLANSEYEAWFVTAAASIAGHRSIDPSVTPPADPEAIRDAKGWLSSRMPPGRSYRETVDQPALTSVFDLASARLAPSFDKMWREVSSLLTQR